MYSSPSRRGADSLLSAVHELTHDISCLLDREVKSPEAAGAPSCRRTLDDLWDLVTGEMLRTLGDGATTPHVLASLTSILGRIRAVEAEAAQLETEDHATLLTKVQQALARVGDAQTVHSLLARAPEVVCSLGFDRALLSTVDGSWRLHSMHVVKDPRWAEEIVAVGRENPPLLDRTLVENDAVVGVQAKLVHEVQANPRVNRPLAAITKSSSYGIAPLLVDGDVVGLVHGDCYHQQRNLTSVDRALLSMFAEGMSQSLARVTVVEGLSSIRAQMEGLARWTDAPGEQFSVGRSVELSRVDDSVLTRREIQVVGLMADGNSNAKIARRLVISEGTVKTHVTHILRKLDAANRAEAVSIWLHRSSDKRS